MRDARRRHNRAIEQAAAARLARLKAASARKQTRKQAHKQAAPVASAARKQAAAAVSAAVRKQAAAAAAAAAAAYRADEATGKRMREQAAAATGRDITAVGGWQVQGRFGLELHCMVKIDDVTVPLLDGESVAKLERDGELVIDIIHRIWVGKKYNCMPSGRTTCGFRCAWARACMNPTSHTLGRASLRRLTLSRRLTVSAMLNASPELSRCSTSRWFFRPMSISCRSRRCFVTRRSNSTSLQTRGCRD